MRFKLVSSLFLESKAYKAHRREQEEQQLSNNRKDVAVRRSTSSGGWNLQDNSDSEGGNEKQLDWEVRGAMQRARELALEQRRNDLRRQIAKIDQHDSPMVISSMPVTNVASPPFREDEVKPEKKKKSKSDKSKKKMKKKSHKNDRVDAFMLEGDFGEKSKKSKSSNGKKKKKHSNDSDREIMPIDIPYRKGEFESEVFPREYHVTKKRTEDFRSSIQAEQVSKSRQSDEPKREKLPELYESDGRHYDKRSRSPHVTQIEVRPPGYENEQRPSQFKRGQKYERESRQAQLARETRQLEQEERQFELERERQVQLEKESRQFEREAQLGRESRKAQYPRESRPVPSEREPRQFVPIGKTSRQFERDSRPPSPPASPPPPPPFEREPRQPQYERKSRQQAFERSIRPKTVEKDIRPSYFQQVPHSPKFEKQSRSPPFEKDTRLAPQNWESRPSSLETRSPVIDKRHREHHIEEKRNEEQTSHADHPPREKQKTSKSTGSEILSVSHTKEETGKKKLTPQQGPLREKKQSVEQKESMKEVKKSHSKAAGGAQKPAKPKGKKSEKPKEAVAVLVQQDKAQDTTQKAKSEKKKRVPRTPSPDFKQLPLSMDVEPSVSLAASAKQEKKVSRMKPSQTTVTREVKPFKKDKPLPKQQANESISESSDSDTSSSSSESDSENVGTDSADEVKNGNSRSQHVEAKRKKEPVVKEIKKEQRQDKKAPASREKSEQGGRSAEGTKERTKDEPRKVTEERERHTEDRKVRVPNSERREEERLTREQERDHRRTRDEEPERRMKGLTDVKEPRDSRDHRDYREFPRLDYRDPRERERFREFDERLVCILITGNLIRFPVAQETFSASLNLNSLIIDLRHG